MRRRRQKAVEAISVLILILNAILAIGVISYSTTFESLALREIAIFAASVLPLLNSGILNGKE